MRPASSCPGGPGRLAVGARSGGSAGRWGALGRLPGRYGHRLLRTCCPAVPDPRDHRLNWFALHGVTVTRVLTDNGVGYRSRLFGAALADTGVRHQRTRPYRPQTNGKVERCNRTLLDEWPTGGCTGPIRPATRPCSRGSIGITITEPTPPSAAGHPSAASTTSLVITPSLTGHSG